MIAAQEVVCTHRNSSPFPALRFDVMNAAQPMGGARTMTSRLIGVACVISMLVACGGSPDGSMPDGGNPGPGPGPGPSSCSGGCSAGYVCKANACTLDPAGLWVLTLKSGTISERGPDASAWDTLGGLPDPFVCLTVNGARKCSSTIKDTL